MSNHQGGCCNPPPPLNHRNRSLMNLVLVSMDRYWSLLTINTSITKIGEGVMKLWCHMARAKLKMGIFHNEYVKIQDFARKFLNIGISPLFSVCRREMRIPTHPESFISISCIYFSKFRLLVLKNDCLVETPPTSQLWRPTLPPPYLVPQFIFHQKKAQDVK